LDAACDAPAQQVASLLHKLQTLFCTKKAVGICNSPLFFLLVLQKAMVALIGFKTSNTFNLLGTEKPLARLIK
jgi:hypothetical protein